MNPTIGIAVKDVKQFFREKGTIFWTIAFPIIILLLFTAIFGRDIPFNANIGIVDNDHTDISRSVFAGLSSIGNTTVNGTGLFNVKEYTNVTEAHKDLNASKIRAVIVIPSGFGQSIFSQNASVSLVVDGSNPDTARIIKDSTRTFFSEYYKAFHYRAYQFNYSEPIVVKEEVASFGRNIGYKENIVPGMLTYPLLFSSMVASTGAIVYERERGTLKKIRASPIHPINMLIGKTLAALFQTAIAIIIMSVLAAVLLGPKLNWNIPLLVPILFLGSMNGIALGLIISCIGRAPQEASNAATTIGVVLQFFTGMYFPIEYLPTYMQQIGRFIPMTYAAQALRDIMIRNATLENLLMPIATLIVTAIVLYGIGVLLYRRWVEK